MFNLEEIKQFLIFSLEERRKRFGKRWRRKNLVRKLLKRTEVMFSMVHRW